MDYNEILSICEEYRNEIVKLRRDFHKYAEAGWLEFRTTSQIAEILEKNDIKFHLGEDVINRDFIMGRPDEGVIKRNIQRALIQGADKKYIDKMNGLTGLMAVIDTGRPGKTIGLRYDIDSNDVVESVSQGHRPYSEGFSSVNEGFDHACGHDGHTAIGIITALVLNRIKDNLNGKIKIFFQPAEEGVRGALSMTETKNFDDIDYMLGGHIGFGSFVRNTLITNTSGFLSTTKFDAEFVGKSSHAGAAPELGKNALLAAASATLNVYAQCQDGRGASRVNVGYLSAGTGRNVVADHAIMKIETRGQTTEINELMYEKALRTIKASAEAYDVEVKTSVKGAAAGCSGSRRLADIIKSVVSEAGFMDEIKDDFNMNGSEDATYMMGKVLSNGGMAVYMIFGTPVAAPHHNNCFDFDEDVLINAVKVYTTVISKLNNIKNE